jgi:hypothetical protein
MEGKSSWQMSDTARISDKKIGKMPNIFGKVAETLPTLKYLHGSSV